MTHDTILILEDDDASRKKLVEIFQDEYKILEVSNEKDGIDALKNHASSLALVLVNLMIPGRDNFQVLQRLRFEGRGDQHRGTDRISCGCI